MADEAQIGGTTAPMGQAVGATTQDPVIVSLHEYRKQIDACIQVAEEFMRSVPLATPEHGQYAREMALVRTKLQEAKMWAGKCLEVYGSPFPENLRDKAQIK